MKIERSEIHNIVDEYVLGLLDARTAEEIDRQIKDDPELKAAVAATRDRFLPLDTALLPEKVRPGMWEKIDAALPVQEGGAAASRKRPANDNAHRWWRITAISAVASTICLALGLAFTILRAPEPVVIAILLNTEGQVHAVVEDFGNRHARITLLKDFEVPEGKTIQAWTLPSQEMGPISMGLLDDGHSGALELPLLPPPRQEQLYELTLEDEGGSPTGRPTGVIIAKGFAALPI